MTQTQHIPYVLHVAAWWPTAEKPGNGLFIGAHIRSIQSIKKHVVVYLKIEKGNGLFPSSEVEHIQGDLEELIIRIKTPIRRFGIDKMLVNRGYKKAVDLIRTAHGTPVLHHIHVRSHLSKFAIAQLIDLPSPMVLTEHFSFYHRGIYDLPKREQDSHRKELKAFFSDPNLKAVMPVSDELRRILIEQFSARPNEVRVIPNIADPCFQYAETPRSDKIKIALVAAWHYPKNPFIFFDALLGLGQKVKNQISIDIVGHGSQLEKMQSIVESSLAGWDITMHGYMTKPNIARIMQRADFFCHPTDQENLPTVIAESLCCGTPVLSMNVNGIPEMINSTNGHLVKAKDINDLKKGISQMMDTCREFDRIGISQAAHENYDASVVGKAIDDVYFEVLK